MIARLLPFVLAPLVLLPGVAAAQTASPDTVAIEGRVGRLERELRAVQRKVFPGGAGSTVAPELQAEAPTVETGAPATAPVADLTARLDALERQLAAVTGSAEQAGNRLRLLEEQLTRLQARVGSVEGQAAVTGGGSVSTAAVRRPAAEPADDTVPPAAVQPAAANAAGAAARADEGGGEATAVERPSTGDAQEDDYTYGYRLYSARRFPEAQAQLKRFTAKYPVASRRWSYAQNLLGRAYLDEGKPALASVALYENYQKAPRGERAAESLYWLGQALTRLRKPADACKVYDEFRDVYGAKAPTELRTRVAKGRADARCPA